MTLRSCALGLVASIVITLFAVAGSGATATIFVLTGRPGALFLLVSNALVVVAGLWLAHRWVSLLITAALLKDAAIERAWSGEAR